MLGPVLFSIGSLKIYTFGFGVALAGLLGMLLSRHLAKREGYHPDLITDFLVYALLAGVAGARLWEVAFTWDNYKANPLEILAIWKGGLSIQGGVLGGILIGIWYARKKNIPIWKLADIVAPGLILGMAIGRLGDFFTGDDFGIVSETFGVVYPPGTIAYNVNGAVPLIPTVLFESIADLIIVGILLFLRKRKPFDGFLFLWMLVLYSVARFFLEFLRGDGLLTFFNLKTAQVTSVITIIIAIAFLIQRKLRYRQNT